MARVPSKHGRDQALDFEGFLNNLQDWELSVKDKDKKINQSIQKGKSAGVVDESRMETRKAPTVDYAENNFRKYDFLSKYNEVSRASNTEQNFVDASREKEQGNEYFKQKKFKEAIDCYSQSIALSPTAVAYANRAMAYLKIKRFQEAEDDCTEALNLDDRYIKAYSRRVTARKELGNLKEAMADAEFAGRLEPHNEEIKKQFAETKSLLEKAILQKASGSLQGSAQDTPKVGKSDTRAKAQVILSVSDTSSTGVATVQEHLKEYGGKGPVKSSVVLEEIDNNNIGAESRTEDAVESSDLGHVKRYRSARKQELKPSVQELASRAASRAMLEASRSITPPNTAYEFEASWRGFSGDYALQACLLKAISPTTLPQIFKNALTAPILVDIVKCIATFFTEEMELAISFLENLTKVPRFGMLIMCLSSTDKSDINKIWYEVFCNKSTPIEYTEKLDILRSQYDSRR